ncbi:hypothetical protein Tco_0444991 [Tanacetum coccineum]
MIAENHREEEDQEGNNSPEIETLTYHVLATYGSGYLTTLSERRAQADARRTVRSDGSRAYQQPLRTDAEQLCCILLSTHLSGVRVGEAGGRPPPSLPITWREAGSRGARRPPPRSIVRSGRLSRESERERDNLGMRMRRLHHAVSVSQNVAISILV